MRSASLLLALPYTRAEWLWQPTTFSTASITRQTNNNRQSDSTADKGDGTSAGGSEDPALFGPKEKGRLCSRLISTSKEFDVDASGGLDWNEFYGFVDGILGAVRDGDGDGANAVGEFVREIHCVIAGVMC